MCIDISDKWLEIWSCNPWLFISVSFLRRKVWNYLKFHVFLNFCWIDSKQVKLANSLIWSEIWIFGIYWSPSCGWNGPMNLGLPVLLPGYWWESLLGIATSMVLGGDMELCMRDPDCFGKISIRQKWSR